MSSFSGGSRLTRKIKKHKQKVRQTRKYKLKPKPRIKPKQKKTKKIQTHKPKYLSATPKMRSILRKKMYLYNRELNKTTKRNAKLKKKSKK